jgi:hypothetical protein
MRELSLSLNEGIDYFCKFSAIQKKRSRKPAAEARPSERGGVLPQHAAQASEEATKDPGFFERFYLMASRM